MLSRLLEGSPEFYRSGKLARPMSYGKHWLSEGRIFLQAAGLRSSRGSVQSHVWQVWPRKL